PFCHHIPVSDWFLEHRQRGYLSEMGVIAGTKEKLMCVGGKMDVDGENPQLPEHLQDAFFRRNRQRKQYQINARVADELQDIADVTELWNARAVLQRTVIAAIIKYTYDIQI